MNDARAHAAMTWKRSVDIRVAWLILQEAYVCLDVSRFLFLFFCFWTDVCFILFFCLLPFSLHSSPPTFPSPLPPPSNSPPPSTRFSSFRSFSSTLPSPSSFAFDMACEVGWSLNTRCYFSFFFLLLLTLASVSMLDGEYAAHPSPLPLIRPECLLHSVFKD